MTHAVKNLGIGSMQQGFSRIGAFFSEEVAMAAAKGLATGRIQGGIIGVLGASAVGGIIAYAKHKKKKNAEHYAEGQRILKTLETEPANESDVLMESYPEPESDASVDDDMGTTKDECQDADK